MAPPRERPWLRILGGGRARRIASYTTTQVLVQLLGVCGGLVLVHFMAQEQYGHYTLAISLLGLFSVLLDLGLSAAVLSLGGPLHPSAHSIGGLLADAYRLQRQLATATLFVLVPAGAAMLAAQGIAPLQVAALCTLVIACAAFNVRNQLALSIVRLRGDLVFQQRVEIGVNLGKLLFLLAAALVFIDARVAMAVNLAAAAMTFALLHRYLVGHAITADREPGEHTPALRGFVRRQAPNAIYYCFSGQIGVLLVGLLGDASRVAEVGALGRLAAVLGVIGAVLAAMAYPYFARPRSGAELKAGFIATNIFFAALAAALVALALLLPDALLWLLGPAYAHLHAELVWMVLSAILASWAAALCSLGMARGWVVPVYVTVACGTSTVLLSAALFDLSTVSGAFLLNTATAAVTLLTVGVYVGRAVFRQRRSGSATR